MIASTRFDPRSRAGSDDAPTPFGPLLEAFRSALPRGERRDDAGGGVLCDGFRSALPRGERPAPGALDGAEIVVSIRAPARGATPAHRDPIARARFRSALPRGERHGRRRRLQATGRFRSALPRGERPLLPDRPVSAVERFDPRSRAGSDLASTAPGFMFAKFRSALPRGERHQRVAAGEGALAFRSALPRGERRVGRRRQGWSLPVSIRAPARGATAEGACGGHVGVVSIRAPARGATRRTWEASRRAVRVSIRAPARGATRLAEGRQAAYERFDPRSRAGSDQPSGVPTAVTSSFDPRSRAGSDHSA